MRKTTNKITVNTLLVINMFQQLPFQGATLDISCLLSDPFRALRIPALLKGLPFTKLENFHYT